jgi:hypothetical protein
VADVPYPPPSSSRDCGRRQYPAAGTRCIQLVDVSLLRTLVRRSHVRSAGLTRPPLVYPQRARRSFSLMRYAPTHSARHSSTLVAMSWKTLVNISPALYDESIDSPVKGLMGGFSTLKLWVPSSDEAYLAGLYRSPSPAGSGRVSESSPGPPKAFVVSAVIPGKNL